MKCNIVKGLKEIEIRESTCRFSLKRLALTVDFWLPIGPYYSSLFGSDLRPNGCRIILTIIPNIRSTEYILTYVRSHFIHTFPYFIIMIVA